jgi:hypothetical protein
MTAPGWAGWTCVEHGARERELYDIGADPCQRGNSEGGRPGRAQKAPSTRLRHLADSAAESCRSLEDFRSASSRRGSLEDLPMGEAHA